MTINWCKWLGHRWKKVFSLYYGRYGTESSITRVCKRCGKWNLRRKAE